MKILLIHPQVPRSYYNNEFYAPIGLLYLAAVLKQAEEDVRIVDLRTINITGQADEYAVYEQKLIDSVSGFRPELVGIGCLYSGQFSDMLRYTILIKKHFPRIPIVVGGIHPTIYARDILERCSSIDWVVLGEGEETLRDLIKIVKTGGCDFAKLDGFAYRQGGRVVVNPKKHFIQNLDTIPLPAYDLLEWKDYHVDTSDWYNPRYLSFKTSCPIVTSRSCPNRCSFCSMFMVMGPRWRARSPGNVVDEIEHLYSEYGHRHFSFMDDNLTLRKEHILGICRAITKRKLNIQFETPNGVATGTLDKDVMDAMVEAGLVRISLAIESGSDYIRNKVMGKRLDRGKIFEVVQLAKHYKDLYVKAFFIIGMPEETLETLEDTYSMIRDLNVDRIYLHNVVPFPGTALFAQALRDNLLVDLKPEDFYNSEELYLTNYDRIFIKPYNLELHDLREFRKKCCVLIEQQKARRESERRAERGAQAPGVH